MCSLCKEGIVGVVMLHTPRESSVGWGEGRGLFLESALQGKEYSIKQVSLNRFILEMD